MLLGSSSSTQHPCAVAAHGCRLSEPHAAVYVRQLLLAVSRSQVRPVCCSGSAYWQYTAHRYTSLPFAGRKPLTVFLKSQKHWVVLTLVLVPMAGMTDDTCRGGQKQHHPIHTLATRHGTVHTRYTPSPMHRVVCTPTELYGALATQALISMGQPDHP
jgi:hypothetical protein